MFVEKKEKGQGRSCLQSLKRLLTTTTLASSRYTDSTFWVSSIQVGVSALSHTKTVRKSAKRIVMETLPPKYTPEWDSSHRKRSRLSHPDIQTHRLDYLSCRQLRVFR